MGRPRLIAGTVTAAFMACRAGWTAISNGQALSAGAFRVPGETDVLLDFSCSTCHAEDTPKGDIRLDRLTERESTHPHFDRVIKRIWKVQLMHWERVTAGLTGPERIELARLLNKMITGLPPATTEEEAIENRPAPEP